MNTEQAAKLYLGRDATDAAERMLDIHDSATCTLGSERAAVTDVVGILVCSDCYSRYDTERKLSDGQFPRRPFLQRLIAASADREK